MDTYLDGELSPPQLVEVETHLAQCACCRERIALDRALRASMKRIPPLRAPDSFRDRMRAVMAAERFLQEQKQAPWTQALPVRCHNDSTNVLPFRRPGKVAAATQTVLVSSEPLFGRVVSWTERRSRRTLPVRYAAPFVMAAGVAFLVSVHLPSPPPAKTSTSPSAPTSFQAHVGLDGIVEDLISLHAQPLPPEVTQPDEVRRFDPFVGVPVEPPKLQRFGAKWEGGRILPLRNSRAAVLQYSMAGGHRISVYVYDPRRVRPESSTLKQRVVRDTPIYVGNIRGYNVAATERQGIGYAVATDLDEPENIELIAASAP
ncbi:MAG: zf-HC2 domain-containing protein [Myxococcales bacterium]|nr:zf-HC2 domain-containing protein [Polyangiaceae bacterium]MDW8251159.1 zf-HC2 domain-containing protein [Myxococcales bacterium]